MAFSITEGFANIIDGQKRSATTTLSIINPATEEVFARVPNTSRAQLEETIDAAERAFPAWSAKPWEERQEALNDLAALLEDHAAQFTELLMREIGKDKMSADAELGMAIPWLRSVAKQRLDDEILIKEDNRVVRNRFRPFGVVAGIATFNFPLVLSITKASQALLAGNCIIVKAHPTAPCTVLKFVELAQSIFPPGVFSALAGGNELGEWIVQHPRIMRLSMTGSTTAGKAVMRGAADQLKSITLELGGNDPAIFLDDVDPKEMAEKILIGALSTAGQTCFQMKRIYVHDRVYDAVRDAFIALAKTLKVGNPFEEGVSVGPVHNRAQYTRLRGLLADCKQNGYTIAYESAVPASKGFYIPIIIVDNPPEHSRIVREEQFGPIVPLLRWTHDDEVVQRANGTEYGLGASVWGHDMERVQRIADGLCNGMVWINEWGVVGGEIPLTGVKHSGVGVESSQHGLTSWAYVQSFARTVPRPRARAEWIVDAKGTPQNGGVRARL